MIISNEPGYYESGKFGIRIESLMVIKKATEIKSPLQKDFCEFETITMTPIQLKLIDKNLLTNEEILWINDYHQTVLKNLTPLMQEKDLPALEYLQKETQPLPLH